MNGEAVLALLRSRRVMRDFTPEPVAEEDLVAILEAGRWASSGSNNRVHRFLVVRDPRRVGLVKAISPGMLGSPPALILICADEREIAAREIRVERDRSIWIDVGTAAMNMMVEAHALGLGTCPTTSFSKPALSAVLELPGHAAPRLFLQIGHPAVPLRPRPAAIGRWTRDNTYWERWGTTRPEASIPPNVATRRSERA
jgi:nitroreductase